MDISASEISVLCGRISSGIEGYALSGVYSIRGGILLRLHHESRPEKMIAISRFAAWFTSKNLSLDKADPFVGRIRTEIERSRLVEVRQEGSERVATFVFEPRASSSSSSSSSPSTSLEGNEQERNNKKKATLYHLHAEFFGGGNIVLSDSDEVILEVEFARRFRHRSLLPGESYLLPPLRGKNLSEISSAFLASAQRELSDKLTAVRWFGRLASTSRKFVEEIFAIALVDPNRPASDLAQEDLESLAQASLRLEQQIEKSPRGYLLLPKEADEEAEVETEEAVEVDACPMVTTRWRTLQEKGRAEIQEYSSFNDALDEAEIQGVLFEKRTKASSETRSKIGELESAISKQQLLLDKNARSAEKLRTIAAELIRGIVDLGSANLVSELGSIGVLEEDETSGGKFRFITEPRSYLASHATAHSLASRLYDEAKKLEEQNRGIVEVRKSLEEKRSALLEQTRLSEDRAEKRVTIERRAREWFERYRWFLTSDLRLCVGGRDSTSNSIVINKYADQNDYVFHADLHGSPFFVLKGRLGEKSSGEPMSPEVEFEIAQATVAFSRAWKDELSSADSYWVRPDQVKKSAPSGEYLPRGSFFIEGKKNFAKHMRVELAVGIVTSEKISLVDRESQKEEAEQKIAIVDQSNLPPKELLAVVVCGPEKALVKYCTALVRIAPGKEKSSEIARRIKQLLVQRSKQGGDEIAELTKRISIDEVIRALPSGGYKIVSEKKQNG